MHRGGIRLHDTFYYFSVVKFKALKGCAKTMKLKHANAISEKFYNKLFISEL